ncbi:transcriptional regulator, AbrB family [Peptoanaerobacter stomatis]|uniref:Transcriptional regulator, AbrB family n=1 Tax=Peptoanaerobacter stomatis TaxID=796937 RepID=J5W9L9_9FIRM|nr:AbrB/MazE/SpoVT family DNA-binding domain-containing protein [Peptoanaerobacter stomatis]EJU20377.1 transcriptional regulator, AbrB family [Peptoanaerobacter stomatis]
MLNEKKISKSGCITIPSHIRRELGIGEGEKVKVDVNTNGEIILSRITGSCILCGGNENLIKIDDKYICKSCIDKINEKSEADKK